MVRHVIEAPIIIELARIPNQTQIIINRGQDAVNNNLTTEGRANFVDLRLQTFKFILIHVSWVGRENVYLLYLMFFELRRDELGEVIRAQTSVENGKQSGWRVVRVWEHELKRSRSIPPRLARIFGSDTVTTCKLQSGLDANTE